MVDRRLVLAFMIAPISFGLLFLLVSSLLGKFGEGVFVLQFVAFVGYPLALIVGLPLYAFFRYLRWNGLTVYIVSGICFSLMLSFLFVIGPIFLEGQSFWNLTSPPRLAQIGIITFACVLTVLTFWMLARPDKQ